MTAKKNKPEVDNDEWDDDATPAPAATTTLAPVVDPEPAATTTVAPTVDPEPEVEKEDGEPSFTERTEQYCTEHRVGTKAARVALRKMDFLEKVQTIQTAKQIGTIRELLTELADEVF